MNSVRLYSGYIREGSRTELPDDTPVLFGKFGMSAIPGLQTDPIVTVHVDDPAIAGLFETDDVVVLLGTVNERNLVVHGVPRDTFEHPDLARLAQVYQTLRAGKTIVVREGTPGSFQTVETFSVSYGESQFLPSLCRSVTVTYPDGRTVATTPEPVNWTLNDLLAITAMWPEATLSALAPIDPKNIKPWLATLMVLDQRGTVRIPGLLDHYAPFAITLRTVGDAAEGQPTIRFEIENGWPTSGLQELICMGHPDTTRLECHAA